MGGYIIHTPGDLTPDRAAEAAAFGPRDVCASAPPDRLACEAGFVVTVNDNVTERFRGLCEIVLEMRDRHEDRLRAEEGDTVFEEERDKKSRMLHGIQSGLLERSFIVAEKQ